MEEDGLGIRIQSEVVEVTKDEKGFVGVSIGGGHPFCPCVYVVQIFENSPVDIDGRIKAGDEVVAVNSESVKGARKTDVAKMIQGKTDTVKLTINHLDVDVQKGKTMDIVLKKIKHKMVEFMEADTADALGLSRAILCNDPLVRKMRVLEKNAELYRTLVDSLTSILNTMANIAEQQKTFGDVFCEVGAHERQNDASEVFTDFGNSHRLLERRQTDAVKQLRPLVADLATYVEIAVPDTQLTVQKYLDIKYEYLSYCLKLKEMDDEEMEFHSLGEPLYRVETGNYEYRVMLRCRQETRSRFMRMRNDVMVKIELLDQKHVRDMAMQLSHFARAMKSCQADCAALLEKAKLEPIEVDISQVEARIAGATLDESKSVEEAEEAVEAPIEVADLLQIDEDASCDLPLHNQSPFVLEQPTSSNCLIHVECSPPSQAPPTSDNETPALVDLIDIG